MKFMMSILSIFALASPALAVDEKIDPATYICAELVASNTTGQPPLFEALQLDGYLSGQNRVQAPDPDNLAEMLIVVSDSCAAKPTDRVLDHWKQARKSIPANTDGAWRADKTTCGDYYANEEDGSGFIIWLDAWQRATSGKPASVFTDQETLDKFLAACKNQPGKLVREVMAENAR